MLVILTRRPCWSLNKADYGEAALLITPIYSTKSFNWEKKVHLKRGQEMRRKLPGSQSFFILCSGKVISEGTRNWAMDDRKVSVLSCEGKQVNIKSINGTD